MPGTQPRGTHAFDPSGSSSQSAQMLDLVNAEEDGAEDQDGPPLDLSLAEGTSTFPHVTPDLVSGMTPSVVSPLLSLPSVVSSLFPSDRSSSGGTRPPPSSSLPPSVHPNSTQRSDISMSSVYSRDTDSDTGNSQFRKRKHDEKSASGSGIRPPSSKRSAKSKTSDVNPVIISNALNSTLNRLADVMEKTLDAPPAGSSSPSVESQTTQPSSMPSHLNPPSACPEDILNQAIRATTSSDSNLSEDELLAASLFFTTASDDAIRAARTFVALGNNQVVQRRFLLRQLDAAALLPGKGKGKDGEDSSMVY
jgi:hypothetical protein